MMKNCIFTDIKYILDIKLNPFWVQSVSLGKKKYGEDPFVMGRGE